MQLRDLQGNIAASYQYDSWGKLTSTPTGVAAMLNPYRYADYRYDDATGLYYLIGRYYDSNVGRFLSPDPTNVIPDYTYGGNNPLSYVDQNGYAMAAPSGGGGNDSTNYDYNCTDNSYDYRGDDGSTDSSDSSNYGSSDSSDDSASSASAIAIPLMPAASSASVEPVVSSVGEGTAFGEAAIEVEVVGLETPAAPVALILLVVTAGIIVGSNYMSAAKQNDRSNQTAGDVIAREKKGAINKEFPSEYRDKTIGEIEKAAKSGDRAAQKAKKLLNDKRFDKGDNRK